MRQTFCRCNQCHEPIIRCSGDTLFSVKGLRLSNGTCEVRCARCFSAWQVVPIEIIHAALIPLYMLPGDFTAGTVSYRIELKVTSRT